MDTPRRVPVRLAMLKIRTSTAPEYEYDVDLVIDCLRKAEEVFAAEEPYIPNELRLFIAPEWFFRKPDDPYSHAQMRHIVDELLRKTGTDEFQHWLVIPGTIYFGLGYDHKILDGELEGVRDDIKNYFKLPKHADVPVRPEPGVAPVRWFVGNLAVAAFRGEILGYHFKTFQQDIDPSRKQGGDPIERWAMEALPLKTRLVCSHNPPFFRVPELGLGVALEICRDHNQFTNQFYYHGFWDGPGTHIHILMCNGVEFRKAACVARQDGYFLRCDSRPEIQCHRIDTPAERLDPGEIMGKWRSAIDMPALLDDIYERIQLLQVTQRAHEKNVSDMEEELEGKWFYQNKQPLESRLASEKRELGTVNSEISRLSLDSVHRMEDARGMFNAWDSAGQSTVEVSDGTLGETEEIDVDHDGALLVYKGRMEFDVLPLSKRKK